GADATAGSYATGSLSALLGEDLSSAGTGGEFTSGAVAVFDYQNAAAVSFTVDGAAIDLNADYTNQAGVIGAIQTQLDTAFGGGAYTVAADGTAISITNNFSAAAPV